MKCVFQWYFNRNVKDILGKKNAMQEMNAGREYAYRNGIQRKITF